PPNPEADVTLEHAVATIRRSRVRPDFVVFTGDLTHTAPDATTRRARMTRFRELAAGLGSVPLRFLPGEHDAAPDQGEAFREHFGDMHWAFTHKGGRFVGLDNASDPMGALGATQLEWLRAEVAALPRSTPLVVFAHRPLFDLYPAWEWETPDG